MCMSLCADVLKSDQLGAHRPEVLAATSKLLMVILNRLDNAFHSQVKIEPPRN